MTIKVLVVDDSALIREVLTAALAKEGDIEVVGTAEDPMVARRRIKELNPDVVTLDIEMPNMNGLAFLDKLMRLRPMPVVMVSTLTQKGAAETMLALELGAVDFVAKPRDELTGGLDRFGMNLRDTVRAAAASDVKGRAMRPADTVSDQAPSAAGAADGSVIAIGASTGGVDAIQRLLTRLPPDCPPILIAQHMPAHFTARFAQRLDQLCALHVVEAEERMLLQGGHVYVAKGGSHLRIEKSSGTLKCRVEEDAAIGGHRPSADALFSSVAQIVGDRAVGIILTGMGQDGARGLKLMRDAGAHTMGQARGSALVYGMPRAALEIGAVAEEVFVEDMARKLVRALTRDRNAAA